MKSFDQNRAEFLRDLIEESKADIKFRDKKRYFLRNESNPPKMNEKSKKVLVRRVPKKRTFDQILTLETQKGDVNQKAVVAPKDREVEIQRLQFLMAFGDCQKSP